jgi:hypothetical protein
MTITIPKKVTTIEETIIEVNIPSYWKRGDIGIFYKITDQIDFVMERHIAISVRTSYPEISRYTTNVMDWDHLKEISKEEFEKAYAEILEKLKP